MKVETKLARMGNLTCAHAIIIHVNFDLVGTCFGRKRITIESVHHEMRA